MKIKFAQYKNVKKENSKYYISLIKECIKENKQILKALNEHYTEIAVYFFKKGNEEKQLELLSDFFGRHFKKHDRNSSPANAKSEKNKGLIIVNTDNVKKNSEKRVDYKDIRDYHKLMMFEELCHLVEQKGDSLYFPKSANSLFRKYGSYLKTLGRSPDIVFEIIKNLNANRNHYEVYKMMAKSYPKLFYKRWSVVFWEEDNYLSKYKQWKKNLNQNIALARLISDYVLRKILFIIIKEYELYEVKKELLECTIEKTKIALKELENILEDERPQLIGQMQNIDESIFSSHKKFWDHLLYIFEENGLLE